MLTLRANTYKQTQIFDFFTVSINEREQWLLYWSIYTHLNIIRGEKINYNGLIKDLVVKQKKTSFFSTMFSHMGYGNFFFVFG